MFKWIADELNEKHLYFNHKFFKPTFEENWNHQMVKELIWKPVQKVQFGKKSTTQLKTSEVSEVAEIILNNLSVKFGIVLYFPDEIMKQLILNSE